MKKTVDLGFAKLGSICPKCMDQSCALTYSDKNKTESEEMGNGWLWKKCTLARCFVGQPALATIETHAKDLENERETKKKKRERRVLRLITAA